MVTLSLEDYANVMESKRMLEMTESEVRKMLSKKYAESIITKIIGTFIHHKTYHASPINIETLLKIGMRVETDIPSGYYELFDQLYDEKHDEESESPKKRNKKE